MALRIEDRYADMVDMAHDLRAYLEGRVVRAYQTGAVAEFRKWVQRNRGVAAALLFAVVVMVLGSVSTLWKAAEASARAEGERLAKEEERLAKENAQEATHLAQDRLDQYQQMADPALLTDLVREAQDELWPRRPEKVAQMQSWLERRGQIQERLPRHVEALRALEQRGLKDGDTWVFEGLDHQLQHRVLSRFVTSMTNAQEPETQLIAEVEARLAISQEIVTRTVDDYAEEWEFAIADIRDHPLYDGLELTRQVGLIPLESDPVSELWEFLCWESGEPPQRDLDSERWIVTGETGIILVLLPGTTYNMGATTDPKGPNYDPDAVGPERPVQEVTLDPFFISKYEMTQGQWQRLMGENPSYFYKEGQTPQAHPVERVSWTICEEALFRLVLEFPTEAQWEYACRAGTDTPWSSGRDKESLEGAANVADEAYKARFTAQIVTHWNDGYGAHAPVGRFAANDFGLHDVHGNVFEWCQDTWGSYGSREPRPGDGLRGAFDAAFRMHRGGGFLNPAANARSAFRGHSAPGPHWTDLGLRPARGLDP